MEILGEKSKVLGAVEEQIRPYGGVLAQQPFGRSYVGQLAQGAGREGCRGFNKAAEVWAGRGYGTGRCRGGFCFEGCAGLRRRGFCVTPDACDRNSAQGLVGCPFAATVEAVLGACRCWFPGVRLRSARRRALRF